MALPLAVKPETIANTRSAFRRDLRDRLREHLEGGLLPVNGGEWDGVQAITRKDLLEGIAFIFNEPLRPADKRSAEVLSGSDAAIITVWAECPRCGIAQTIPVSIAPQLVVDTGSAELKLKAKSKGRIHMCGQLAMQADPDDDTPSFGLEDIIGPGDAESTTGEQLPQDPDDGPDEDLGPCPFPGCTLEAEHAGDHEIPDPQP